MIIKKNRKAYYDYEIVKSYEAGIVLEGWEVKSIKAGNFTFGSSFITIRNGEAWLYSLNIGNWPHAKKRTDEYRLRDRKLLLRKDELRRAMGLMNESNRLTIVPLEVYTANNLVKMKIGIAKGKRQYEKKEKKKRKDLERSISSDLKNIR